MLKALVVLALLQPLVPARVDDGEALLRKINAAHKGKWWTTLTFVQRSTWPGGSQPEETWYESMDRPGKLRIDRERNGTIVQSVIFRNDSLYAIVNGAARPGRPLVHSLLVLLHDIHAGDIDASIAKLRSEGFDLSKTHADRWEGRPVTVVGAAAGDTTTNQFWVDDARAVVVRLVQTRPDGSREDTRIGGFQSQGSAGLAESDIQFFKNGVLDMHEEYAQIKTGVALPASVFDPAHPELPDWVVKTRGKP